MTETGKAFMSIKWTIVLILISAVVILYLVDVTTLTTSTLPSQGTVLAPVEIRSYQGERLSSVNDFRENSIRGPQAINQSEYYLTVDGLVNSTRVFRYSDVVDNHTSYTKVVTLHCVEGWDATILWEGVLVRDILKEAGIDPRANTVIFYAKDGYSTSFPIAFLMDKDIIMAYRMNNLTLPAERGFPFQLVAEDKWGYKWIKWIDRIELSSDRNYRGYWEQRGYSNTGDLNQSFFD